MKIKKISYSWRKFAYWFLSGIDQILDQENRYVILVFHVIDDGSWFFGNSQAQFDVYLRELSRHYRFISLSEMLDVIGKKKHYPEKVMAFTFDDGYHGIMSVASQLAEYDIKPTVFVLSDPEHANRGEMETDHALLTDSELLLLHYKYGWEIGCHSATHEDLTQLNAVQLKKQILGSKQKLQKDLGIDVRYFAYPKGLYNSDVVNIVKKAGYEAAFTVDNQEIKLLGSLYDIPRIGINRTHTPKEILDLVSPRAISFRRKLTPLIKRIW